MTHNKIVELNHALAGSDGAPKPHAIVTDIVTGLPMKFNIVPGSLIKIENIDRKQMEALSWTSSSH